MKNQGKISESLKSCFIIQFQRFLNWILLKNILSLALNFKRHVFVVARTDLYTERQTKIWWSSKQR
jgi:hypothetical protein